MLPSKPTKPHPTTQKNDTKSNPKKQPTRSSKPRTNMSVIEQPPDKNSAKKVGTAPNYSAGSSKKRPQHTNSPYDKHNHLKQNCTPSKKQQLPLKTPLYLAHLPKNKGVAAIKNIKKKIIGELGICKTDREPTGAPLKEKSQNLADPNLSKLLQQNQQVAKKTPGYSPAHLTKESFEFGKKLGKGRFGDVFIARHRATGFALAIKVMDKAELLESDMQAQLAQEIKTQTYCSHPNILKMYGCFSDEQNIYLLLELGTHHSLFHDLKLNRHFPEQTASYWLREVCAGVGYLHRNSIIHRDIKPENIINCFGVLKLCDFGWAAYSPIYQRQTFCGTLDYVSPQIVTGDYYDEKVDIWCLGVLCYQLCTGKPPFESKNNKKEVYNKILNLDIEYPITLSLALVDLLGKILDKDPRKRINLQQIQNHEWIKNNENETGRMIRRSIWDQWVKICR